MAVPFRLETEAGVLSFFSTTTVFGTPVDVTLSELALECFLPCRPRDGRGHAALRQDGRRLVDEIRGIEAVYLLAGYATFADLTVAFASYRRGLPIRSDHISPWAISA